MAVLANCSGSASFPVSYSSTTHLCYLCHFHHHCWSQKKNTRPTACMLPSKWIPWKLTIELHKQDQFCLPSSNQIIHSNINMNSEKKTLDKMDCLTAPSFRSGLSPSNLWIISYFHIITKLSSSKQANDWVLVLSSITLYCWFFSLFYQVSPTLLTQSLQWVISRVRLCGLGSQPMAFDVLDKHPFT